MTGESDNEKTQTHHESGKSAGEATPVFGPGSAFWTVCREMALLVGGPAAAVLQAAHPGIGQGVARYSDFTGDSWGRLVRTMEVVWTIGFGTRAEAEAMRTRMIALHERIAVEYRGVGGVTVRGGGMTPDLQFWVLATLIQGTVDGWERIHGPMDAPLRDALYRDFLVFGEYFGLPRAQAPADWAGFRAYYRDMLKSGILASDPVSRQIARHVAQPPRPHWLRWAMKPFRFLLSELLPHPVNDKLGFPSTRWGRRQLRMLEWLLPRVVPWLPPVLRYPPQYRKARRAPGKPKTHC